MCSCFSPSLVIVIWLQLSSFCWGKKWPFETWSTSRAFMVESGLTSLGELLRPCTSGLRGRSEWLHAEISRDRSCLQAWTKSISCFRRCTWSIELIFLIARRKITISEILIGLCSFSTYLRLMQKLKHCWAEAWLVPTGVGLPTPSLKLAEGWWEHRNWKGRPIPSTSWYLKST